MNPELHLLGGHQTPPTPSELAELLFRLTGTRPTPEKLAQDQARYDAAIRASQS